MTKYSIIEDGVIKDIIEGEYDSIRQKLSANIILVPTESHHCKGLNVYEYVFKSNKQKLEDGDIVLAENQIYYPETDYIRTAEENEKVVIEDGVKKIVPKDLKDFLEEGKITLEEYNDEIVKRRQIEYVKRLDSMRNEIIDNVLGYLSKTNKVSSEISEEIKKLVNERALIKEENPKIKE